MFGLFGNDWLPKIINGQISQLKFKNDGTQILVASGIGLIFYFTYRMIGNLGFILAIVLLEFGVWLYLCFIFGGLLLNWYVFAIVILNLAGLILYFINSFFRKNSENERS